MTDGFDKPRPTRRGLVGGAAGLIAAVAAAPAGAAADEGARTEPFWGTHQGGIATAPQRHNYTAAFDLVAARRDEVVAMLRRWTAAAGRMSYGYSAEAPVGNAARATDSGDAMDLPPARLTLTFGFGAGLFVKDGMDRYGLAHRRPEALIELPAFPGDELEDARSGGDVSVQAYADDPQAAFHAVRHLAGLAHGTAALRWAQSGFRSGAPEGRPPRNLMGFKDGTGNLPVDEPAAMNNFVWVGAEGPDWMQDGSYVVFRRIRIALDHWDRMPLDFQEQTFGRHKYSGAPLGGERESDAPDLDAFGEDGEPVIPANAHIRLAAARTNDGARILRRPYSYNDGIDEITERWEPWRRRREYDAGLFFVCYQRDPRTGFVKIFGRLSKFDMLNQFVTHTGGGLFACPGGVAPGEFIGQRLFTA